jgi:hypothetical protein
MVERLPPYDYVWNWTGFRGGNAREFPNGGFIGHTGVAVSRQNGHAEFRILSDGGTAFKARFVGIFFRPPSRNGILTLSSNPSYYSWYVNGGFFHGAVTQAWIGFYIQSYYAYGKKGGFPDREMLRQQEMIYNRDIFWWWAGSEQRSDRSDGFPLNAQITVDSSHSYIIYVWCGGLARDAGWNNSSYAISALSINIPSIIWSYAPI